MSGEYVRDWLNTELNGLFDETDHASVVDWTLTHRGIPKVVLIGSGFSLNANLVDGLSGRIEDRVPLWYQVTSELRRGLGYVTDNQGPWDALLVAEQYQEAIGVVEFRELLLRMLKDDEIRPGNAHNALKEYPVEAIITTNQLDTLLDRMEGKWHCVRQCPDLPVARSLAGRQELAGSAQVIYLHGHRAIPSEWVFSRAEYEDVSCTRPAIVTRVQQLLSEYPLLVLGYSLSDPDFHALFRLIHRRLAGTKPRALCITAGQKAPARAEKVHWLNLGMYLAQLAPTGGSGSGATRGKQIEHFLRLEERRPTPEYVRKSLQTKNCGSFPVTIRARLEELGKIYNDIEGLVPFDYELAELRYNAWRDCFPGLDGHEDDASMLNDAAVEEDRTRRFASQVTGVAGADPSRASFRFQRLPDEKFFDNLPPYLPGILLAVDRLLAGTGDEENTVQVLVAIGDWLCFALEKGVIRSRAATLDGSSREDLVLELLAWIVERGGARLGSMARYNSCVVEMKTRSTAALFYRRGVADPSRANALPELGGAWNAVWECDYDRASSLYERAVETFRKRTDILGEWRALGGVVGSIQAVLSNTRRGDPRRADLENRVLDAKDAFNRLDGRQVVRHYVARRNQLDAAALKEAVLSSEQAVGGRGTQTRLTTIPRVLQEFLIDEASACQFPGYVREFVARGLSVGLFDEPNGLVLALQYCVKEPEEWLERQGCSASLSKQRVRDERLSNTMTQVAAGLVPSVRGDYGSFPSTVVATLPRMLPKLVHRLDPKTANRLAEAELEVLREVSHKSGFEHSFGSVNLRTQLIQALPAVAAALCGMANGGGVAFALLKDVVFIASDGFDRRLAWNALAKWQWGAVLASGGLAVDDVIDWLLAAEPASEGSRPWDSEIAESWLFVLLEVTSVAKKLRLPSAERLRGSVDDVANRRIEAGGNGRILGAALGIQALTDPAVAQNNAMLALAKCARAIGEETEDALESARSAFRSLVMVFVERRLISRELLRDNVDLAVTIFNEVDTLIGTPPVGAPERETFDNEDFFFIAYAVRLVPGTSQAKPWLLQQVRDRKDPPLRAIGLCASRDLWGDHWDDLVTMIMTRAAGDGVDDALTLIHNALLQEEFVNTMLGGDLGFLVPLAVQQVGNPDSGIANPAAWAVLGIAAHASNEYLATPVGRSVLEALGASARSPNVKVRLAVSYGLGFASRHAKSRILREAAMPLVGLHEEGARDGLANDHSGTVLANVHCGIMAGEVAARNEGDGA